MGKELTVSRVKVAENLVAGVQYLAKRDIMTEISGNSTEFSIKCNESRYVKSSVEWVRIEQVGVCPEYTSHHYYTAVQKALFSCHRPDKSQVIFMVHGDGEKVNLYVGIRKLSEAESERSDEVFTENFSAYLNAVLPGSKVKYINEIDAVGEQLIQDIRDKKYRHLYSLTGIPSLMPTNGEESLSSIDTLLGTLSRKRFVYYVVADPLDESYVNNVMIKCMELAGKIESVKSINISEAENISTTIGSSETISETINEGESTAVNMKGTKNHFWCKMLSAIGLGDFVDQSTQTITKGLSHGVQHSGSKNDTRGFAATSSVTLINKCAEYAANQLMLHSKRYESGLGLGMWETGVYLMTEDSYSVQSAAAQLRSVVSGKDSSLEPVRIHNLSQLINAKNSSANTTNALASFNIPAVLIQAKDNNIVLSNFDNTQENFTTVLTTEELSCFINLPQRSIPGISIVDYSSNFSLTPQKVKSDSHLLGIGNLVYSGSQSNIKVNLPIDTLSRHALVCGVNGSGKTNTVLSILDGFMKEDRPFFVIEPAKTEYVDWALEYNKTIQDPDKKIRIFIPGCDNYSKAGFRPDKLCLNPFEVIQLPGSEMRVLSHIDRLKSSFAAAFPMQDILPVIMEHLLYDLYTEAHPMLDKEDANYMQKGFPTLGTVDRRFIDDLMINVGYAQENTQNISAALRTRFKSLKFGWKGELLNNQQLSSLVWDASSNSYKSEPLSWGQLFGAPVVVNLSYAGDDQDRAFIMSLLLQFLYEFRIAESEVGISSFNSNVCRHLVVVEEAHRVMSYCENQEAPQYKSGLMFSNFLSEVRAYGQGMMVVDQVPTRLIEDAIKNTNVKIIHKLVASDDCQKVSECIGLTEDQRKVIARLSIGQAVLAGFNSANVMSENSSDIYLAQINKMK